MASRSRLQIILMLIFFYPCANLQGENPVATQDTSIHGFGTVVRGAIAEMRIEVSNEGQSEIHFSKVIRSMPGMKIRLPRAISPGGAAELLLELDTASYLGDVAGEVALATDSPNRPVLQFDIRGTVASSVSLEPQPPVFLQGFPWDAPPLERTILIRRNDDAPLAVSGLETDGDGFLVKISPVEEGRGHELSFMLNPKGSPGKSVGTVTLQADGERIRFPVFTFLKDRVYISPQDLYFPPVSLSRIRENPGMLGFLERSIFVYKLDGADFEISVQLLPRYLSVKKLPETGPGSVADIPGQGKTAIFELIFSLDVDHLPTGQLNDMVVVTTNDPEFPEFQLPVYLEVH